MTHTITARLPRGTDTNPYTSTAAADLAAHQRDASHYPGGHTPAVVSPQDEAGVAAMLRTYPHILPIGAQSSITGGGTPFGAVILSTDRLNQIADSAPDMVRAGVGVRLGDLQATLRASDRFYPPVPSYACAALGGSIATNAAGPATFRYGSTRRWVQALTVVLATGEVLDIERGQYQAHPDGYFVLEGPAGTRRIPLPTYAMPEVVKCSAGYYAAPRMDLLDLFIGAEGTLGVVTAATVRVLSPAPQTAVLLVRCADEHAALALTAALRAAARAGTLAVSAIESCDARSLALIRAAGALAAHGITVAPEIGALLWVQLELERPRQVPDAIWQIVAPAAAELALPEDQAGQARLLALREAVPLAVNARVAAAQTLDPAVTKVAADMIVPFGRLPQLLALFRRAFSAAGLDHAIWGHVSDGNMHPNALCRSAAEVRTAQQILFAVGGQVIALGGCPLAEHGVGRNRIKQRLLAQLYGAAGVAQMRAVKAALDPQGVLAPGVLFGAD